MKTIVERLLAIWDEERLSAKYLEKMTGIKEKRWYGIRERKVMRTEELEAINLMFPEYAFWLTTGDEIPEAGQISPMTKKAQRNLKNQPKAG